MMISTTARNIAAPAALRAASGFPAPSSFETLVLQHQLQEQEQS